MEDQLKLLEQQIEIQAQKSLEFQENMMQMVSDLGDKLKEAEDSRNS